MNKPSRAGTKGEPGSGLGLSIVKEFVERHSGVVEVKSEAGIGTSFIVSIPAHTVDSK